MIIYIIIIILIVVGYAFLKIYWFPRQLHNQYVKDFKAQGYRVLDVPYQPFGLPFLKFRDSGKDPLKKVKDLYPQYDVLVMNAFTKVEVDFIHPDLLQEFFSTDKLSYYAKVQSTKDILKRGTGEGLVFSEGDEWKMKRKVLTEVFNFDFIKSLAPKIA